MLAMFYFNDHKNRAKNPFEDSKHLCEEIASKDRHLFVEITEEDEEPRNSEDCS
jgi:hypothetical protein